jgi:predicted HicB family RNase H-like nuclease
MTASKRTPRRTMKALPSTIRPIPEPLSLRQYKGAIAVRIPPAQHRELAMEAAEQGVSLNRLISKKLGA